MDQHGNGGACPECGAPAAAGACTHCGHRQRPAGGRGSDDPVEAGDLSADALTVERLQGWYDRQPPGSGQEAHPDAGDVPTLGQEYARAAARRRLDEQTTAARADRW